MRNRAFTLDTFFSNLLAGKSLSHSHCLATDAPFMDRSMVERRCLKYYIVLTESKNTVLALLASHRVSLYHCVNGHGSIVEEKVWVLYLTLSKWQLHQFSLRIILLSYSLLTSLFWQRVVSTLEVFENTWPKESF